MSFVAKRLVDEDATWYGSRPRPRPHCVRQAPSFPAKGAQQPPPLFGQCLLWPRSPISATAELLLHSSRQRIAMLYNRPPLCPLKIAPFHEGSEPHLIRGSLGAPESSAQTASRSVQPFLHISPQSVPILNNGPPFHPQNCLFPWGIWTPI